MECAADQAGARLRGWRTSRLQISGTEHVQDIFPQLSADHREFSMTGATPRRSGTEMFPPDEEGEE